MSGTASNRYAPAHPCRLTYASNALRITSDNDSPRDSATAIAESHKSSGTLTFRLLPPYAIRRGFGFNGFPVSLGDDVAIDGEYPNLLALPLKAVGLDVHDAPLPQPTPCGLYPHRTHKPHGPHNPGSRQ